MSTDTTHNPPTVHGCDDCSVEPGETHRWPGCPGAVRARQRLSATPPTEDHITILERGIGHMGFQFWMCPVEAHRDPYMADGTRVETVQWLDGVAHCTAEGCEHNSAEATPPTGTEA